MMIQSSPTEISFRRQCDPIGLNRSTLCCHPAGESPFKLELIRLIDERYTKRRFYGWPGMTAQLWRLGYEVNHKKFQRLMQLAVLRAVYPQPRTTIQDKERKIYASDIIHVRMHQGLMYLVALMDWFSCFVIAWELSNKLDALFCLQALDQALQEGQPEIFNTDQGVQFTAVAFQGALESAGISISMDRRGRALDNFFVERLWRSVKYEDIYRRDHDTVPELQQGPKATLPLTTVSYPVKASGI